MLKEQLREEIERFNREESIESSLHFLDYFIDCFEEIIVGHEATFSSQKYKADAMIVFKLVLSKLKHLKMTIIQSEDLDLGIVVSLIRGIYEMVCMFHIVYVVPDNAERKKILYNLWVIAGFNYRQKFSKVVKTPDATKKFSDEKNYINTLAQEIKSTQEYNGLNAKYSNIIDSRIKDKDYKILINGGKVSQLSWQQISDYFSNRHQILQEMYTYFSLYAHPSYIPIFQFNSLSANNGQATLQLIEMNLRFSMALASIFISDFVRLFGETSLTFSSLPENKQLIINFLNTFIRGYNYSISNVWQKLD